MLPPVHCPNCNSKQKFVLRKRLTPQEIETYVRCGMCRHEIVLTKESRKEHILRRRQILNRVRRIKR